MTLLRDFLAHPYPYLIGGMTAICFLYVMNRIDDGIRRFDSRIKDLESGVKELGFKSDKITAALQEIADHLPTK